MAPDQASELKMKSQRRLKLCFFVLILIFSLSNIAFSQESTAATSGPADAPASEPPQAEKAQPPTPLQEPEAKKEPFAFADFTWLSGSPRTKESPIETPVFTGEFRVDAAFHNSFNHPVD